MQDRVATPLMITVHEPHWPNPQPKRGPCAPISFRRTYNSGVAESTSNVCVLPFTFKVTLLIWDLLTHVAVARVIILQRKERLPEVLARRAAQTRIPPGDLESAERSSRFTVL